MNEGGKELPFVLWPHGAVEDERDDDNHGDDYDENHQEDSADPAKCAATRCFGLIKNWCRFLGHGGGACNVRFRGNNPA